MLSALVASFGNMASQASQKAKLPVLQSNAWGMFYGAHKAGYAMVMFPVVALVLSALFEGLEIDAPIIVGTLLVLAGNLFVINTRSPSAKTVPGRSQGASTALAVRMSASNMSGCRNDGL